MAEPGPRLDVSRIVTNPDVTHVLAFSVLAAALCLGCGDSSSSGAPGSGTEPEAITIDAQLSTGEAQYGRSCAHCHGGSGEGGDAPRLVGLDRGALPLEPPGAARLRDGEFRTAGDVVDFARANMPIDAPGSLEAEQYYAIVAFLLDANGVRPNAVLDASNAARLELAR